MARTKTGGTKAHICKAMSKNKTVKSTCKGKRFPTKTTSTTCERNNVIYCITDKTKKQQYIGQTSRPLKDRVREHMREQGVDIDENFHRRFKIDVMRKFNKTATLKVRMDQTEKGLINETGMTKDPSGTRRKCTRNKKLVSKEK